MKKRIAYSVLTIIIFSQFACKKADDLSNFININYNRGTSTLRGGYHYTGYGANNSPARSAIAFDSERKSEFDDEVSFTIDVEGKDGEEEKIGVYTPLSQWFVKNGSYVSVDSGVVNLSQVEFVKMKGDFKFYYQGKEVVTGDFEVPFKTLIMRVVLIFLLLIITSNSFCQDKKIRLAVSLDPLVSGKFVYVKDFGIMSKNEFQKAFSYDADEYKNSLKLSGSVNVFFKLTNNFWVGTGLGLANFGYTVKDNQWEITERVTQNAISIPVMLQYNILKEKWNKLYLSARYQADIFYRAKYVEIYNGKKTKMTYDGITDLFSNNPLDRYVTELNFGLGYRIMNEDTLRWEIEPNTSILFFKSSYEMYKDRGFSFGIRVRYFIIS